MEATVRVLDSQVERFWAKVDKSAGNDACWPWTAYRTAAGRGWVQIGSRTDGKRRKVFAHRLAFWIEHGRWPEPCALHTCDNPACCNPRHIVEGTQQENLADMHAKGRNNQPHGERVSTAKLNPQIVCVIRSEARSGVLRAELARRYGVTWDAIESVITGHSWRRVECA